MKIWLSALNLPLFSYLKLFKISRFLKKIFSENENTVSIFNIFYVILDSLLTFRHLLNTRLESDIVTEINFLIAYCFFTLASYDWFLKL